MQPQYDTNGLIPIHLVPEVQAKVKEVKRYISSMLRAKNLFAWRQFEHDLKVDIELEIYKYEDLHRQGKYKENGIGAYCNMAVQGAKNYASFYSAQKRKLNFESISFESLAESDDSPDRTPPTIDDSFEIADIVISAHQSLGNEIGKLVERIFKGEQLSRAELNMLKTPDMYQFLKEMSCF